jgi:hypothetical protein
MSVILFVFVDKNTDSTCRDSEISRCKAEVKCHCSRKITLKRKSNGVLVPEFSLPKAINL